MIPKTSLERIAGGLIDIADKSLLFPPEIERIIPVPVFHDMLYLQPGASGKYRCIYAPAGDFSAKNTYSCLISDSSDIEILTGKLQSALPFLELNPALIPLLYAHLADKNIPELTERMTDTLHLTTDMTESLTFFCQFRTQTVAIAGHTPTLPELYLLEQAHQKGFLNVLLVLSEIFTFNSGKLRQLYNQAENLTRLKIDLSATATELKILCRRQRFTPQQSYEKVRDTFDRMLNPIRFEYQEGFRSAVDGVYKKFGRSWHFEADAENSTVKLLLSAKTSEELKIQAEDLIKLSSSKEGQTLFSLSADRY